MAASKSTPRTAIRLVDVVEEQLARVRAIHAATCLATANEDPGLPDLQTDDLAALRALVSDLLTDVKGAVYELNDLADAADRARETAIMRAEISKFEVVNATATQS